MVNNINYMLF